MGKVDSLKRGVTIWQGAVDVSGLAMKDFKRNHRASWWLRPAYWKIERAHHKLFLELINYRIKYATAIREETKNA